jgi:saccharopine dehydrogenase (NAD+, L-glutamate forming)
MLGEAAVCLALDDLPAAGGFLTPSTAMAAPLLDRLQSRAGMRFEVIERP